MPNVSVALSKKSLRKKIIEAIQKNQRRIPGIEGTSVVIFTDKAEGTLTGNISYAGRNPLSSCKITVETGAGFRRELLSDLRLQGENHGRDTNIIDATPPPILINPTAQPAAI